MTYRTDSDVFMPYGRIMEDVQPGRNSHKVNSNKTGLVSWMVSNCKTQSRREFWVNELRKYLPADSIDVYGSCGSKECKGDSRDNREECWKMLEQNYSAVLKLETLDRDLEWVFKKFDLNHYQHDFKNIMEAQKNKNKGENTTRTSESLSRKYFSQISKVNLRRLYEKYQVDFEMFGYEGQIQKYIDMGYR